MTKEHKEPRNDRPSGELLTKLLNQSYPLETMTPQKEKALAELKKWFEEHMGMKEDLLPQVSVFPKEYFEGNKKAYPNYEQYQHVPGQHNMQKWLQAVRDIFNKEQHGQEMQQSIHQVTSGWNVTEAYDFLNWLKFYQGGNHMKYKQAQHAWYENGSPGYFLPIAKEKETPQETSVSGADIDFAKNEAVMSKEKRDLIEKQRSKIIGRLDSAEKLLRSTDGQSFAGPEFEALMEAIYQLKKKIHLVNKISSSVRLYEDMIVRQANMLARQGFGQAAEVLHRTAQANNPPPAGIGVKEKTPLTTTPPDSPIHPLSPGYPGGLPSMGPGMPQKGVDGAPESGPNDNSPTNLKGVSVPTNTPAAGPASPMPENPVDAFLDNLGEGKDADKAHLDDTLEVKDMIEVGDAEDQLLTEAQTMPPIDEPLTTTSPPAPLNPGPPAPRVPIPMPASPMPKAPTEGLVATDAEEPLEVTEDDIAPDTTEPKEDSDFDVKMKAMFANVSIEEIVSKLENVSNELKAKELSRKLSEVDMMLHGKQMSSLFPQLGESQAKAIDFYNYSNSRIDDILSKLKGALGNTMTAKPNETGPELDAVKNKLKSDEEKEKARKQQRKEQEMQDLSGGKEKPEVELAEDLTPPKPVARPLG